MSNASWTDVFASLPDSGFFEVVRHYAGPVKTPFHKPELVSRMEAFFGREDVLERVFAFLDEHDVRLLTIVAWLNGVSGTRLAGLMPDMSYVMLRERLLNLEERLLIWSRAEGRTRLYTLTPLGEQVKEAGILGPGAIIGEGTDCDVPAAESWLDDNFLTCALAFLSSAPRLFRKEGGWRKKSLENLTESFPSLFRDGRGEEKIIMAGRGLLAMGLVERQDERLVPILSAWRLLEGMDQQERLALVRARAAVGRRVAPEYSVPATRLLNESLPEGRSYSRSALSELYQLATGGVSLSPAGALRVISHLELMGILADDGSGGLARAVSASERTPKAPESLLAVTAVGDVNLQPGSPLFCDIALVGGAGRLDVVAGFTLDKASYQAGLEHGIRTELFLERLESRFGRPVPGNVRTQCLEWESEYRELSVQVGIVLRASGFRREILESTGVLDGLALDNPAPGIWILDAAGQESWRSALAGVGIDRIPGLGTSDSLNPAGTVQAAGTALISWNGTYGTSPLATAGWSAHTSRPLDGILTELAEAAGSAGLSAEETAAFGERLERRVILVSDQIRKGAWRFEVMSAKGLDYRGKIRLAEAAMSGRDERLAVNVAVGNEIETLLILPEKMEKEGDDHVLVGITLPEEEPIRLKIRKIGFLKRIKASLF